MLYHTFSTQEEIDQEYNPRLIVDNTDELIQSYFTESERVIKDYSNYSGVGYGPTLAETLDIFPAKITSSPIHIFFSRWLLAFTDQQGFCFCGRRTGTERYYGSAGKLCSLSYG